MSELVDILFILTFLSIAIFVICHLYFGTLHKYADYSFKIMMFVVFIFLVNISVAGYLLIERIDILIEAINKGDV